jgi:hypothetical protein
VRVRVELYDLPSDTLVYEGRTGAMSPSDAEKDLTELVVLASRELRNQGLIASRD